MSGPIKVSDDRLNSILAYVDEHGEPEACKEFNINIETLHRYQRYSRFNETKNPKILLLDIETAPMLTYTWGLWKQFINTQQIEADWFCISWAAKWLFSCDVASDCLTSKEARNEDDKRIITSMWKMIDEANIIITQNGERFDIPRLNTRFIIHDLTPPSPYQMIDTLKVMKKNFAFSSNKLDYVNSVLGLPQKIHTDFELWRACVHGDQDSLQKMEEYNRNDVLILEETYLKLRPWIRVGVNLAVHTESDKSCCYACGSDKLKEKGYYYTSVSRFVSYVCEECGAYSRSRISDVSKEHKKVLLSPVAR